MAIIPKKERSKPSAGLPDFWDQAAEGKVHEMLLPHLHSIEMEQKDLHELNVRNAVMFDAQLAGQLDWSTGRNGRRVTERTKARTSWNAIASTSLTATALIAHNRSKPSFMTDGGDWSLHRRARLLQKYVLGVMQEQDAWEVLSRAFLHACVFGTGVAKPYATRDRKKIKVETVLYDNLIIDQRSVGSDGYLPELGERCMSDWRQLAAEYPEHRTAIKNAASKGRWLPFIVQDATELVVFEAWRMASEPDAEGNVVPGRHVICIDGADLVDEPYHEQKPPHIFIHWEKPIIGHQGRGIPHRVAGIQVRINRINRHIEACQNRVSNPTTWVHQSEPMPTPRFTNGIGKVGRFRHSKPTTETPQAVGKEMYQERQEQWQMAFKVTGVSEASSTAKKPAGVEAAVAIREVNDLQTLRFSIQEQGFEAAVPELANRIVVIAKQLYEGESDVVSKFKQRNFVKTINWSEVDMELDMFVLHVESASILSRQPAGELQRIIDMVQSNQINAKQFSMLIDRMDSEAEYSLVNADILYADYVIDRIENGEWVAVDPNANLVLLEERMMKAYQRASQFENVPEEVLEMMTDYVEILRDIQSDAALKEMAESQLAQQLDAQMQGGAPGGAPAPQVDPTGAAGGLPPELAAQLGGAPQQAATPAIPGGQLLQ